MNIPSRRKPGRGRCPLAPKRNHLYFRLCRSATYSPTPRCRHVEHCDRRHCSSTQRSRPVPVVVAVAHDVCRYRSPSVFGYSRCDLLDRCPTPRCAATSCHRRRRRRRRQPVDVECPRAAYDAPATAQRTASCSQLVVMSPTSTVFRRQSATCTATRDTRPPRTSHDEAAARSRTRSARCGLVRPAVRSAFRRRISCSRRHCPDEPPTRTFELNLCWIVDCTYGWWGSKTPGRAEDSALAAPLRRSGRRPGRPNCARHPSVSQTEMNSAARLERSLTTIRTGRLHCSAAVAVKSVDTAIHRLRTLAFAAVRAGRNNAAASAAPTHALRPSPRPA